MSQFEYRVSTKIRFYVNDLIVFSCEAEDEIAGYNKL